MQGTVRAVTFDLWHTLLYLDPGAEDAYNQKQVELGVETLEQAPTAGPGTLSPQEAFRSTTLEALRMSERGESLSLDAQITRAAQLAGRRADPTRYVAALERLVASSPFRVAPGAVDAMSRISRRRARIGVIGNTVGEPGRALRRICDREGLSKYVTGWSWSDELPWTKPSPQIFLHCLRQLGGTASRAVHIGDGSWDIEGARAAGFLAGVLFTGLARYGEFYRTVVMRTDPAESRPDFTIHRLDEFPALLDRAFGPDGDSH